MKKERLEKELQIVLRATTERAEEIATKIYERHANNDPTMTEIDLTYEIERELPPAELEFIDNYMLTYIFNDAVEQKIKDLAYDARAELLLKHFYVK